MKRLIVFMLTCVVAALSAAAQPRLQIDDRALSFELVLPVTFDKVWFRADKRKTADDIKSGRKVGELTISEDGVEFASKKKVYAAPMDSIEMISYGKVGNDVNTDWVVMLVNRSGHLRRVAFRDGRKFGYGESTPEIHRVLRATMEKFGAAQYKVEPGFRAFDGVQDQCALAIPESWHSFARSSLQVDGRMRWGELLFSEANITDHTVRFDQTGPAYALDRWQAVKGQTCDHISAAGERALLAHVTLDPMLGEGYEVLVEPAIERAKLGQCDGRRVVARSRADEDGDEWVLDVRAAADGETLYMLVLRSPVDQYETLRALFEQTAQSMKFAVAHE